jgi:uncharacterized Zn finger protein
MVFVTTDEQSRLIETRCSCPAFRRRATCSHIWSASIWLVASPTRERR